MKVDQEKFGMSSVPSYAKASISEPIPGGRGMAPFRGVMAAMALMASPALSAYTSTMPII